jgi:hypothetical protein
LKQATGDRQTLYGTISFQLTPSLTENDSPLKEKARFSSITTKDGKKKLFCSDVINFPSLLK